MMDKQKVSLLFVVTLLFSVCIRAGAEIEPRISVGNGYGMVGGQGYGIYMGKDYSVMVGTEGSFRGCPVKGLCVLIAEHFSCRQGGSYDWLELVPPLI
jgi:hypothetical protein